MGSSGVRQWGDFVSVYGEFLLSVDTGLGDRALYLPVPRTDISNLRLWPTRHERVADPPAHDERLKSTTKAT